MKKFLSLVLALIMTMSLVTISAGATEYRDLTDKDEIQYEEAVAVLNRIGVITGYEDGSFRPETELTRGAAAKIIVSLMIGPDAASALPNNASPYPDVPAGHTFAGVIGYCKTAGYISGYGDGTFKPANPLTGYAFAKMLLGAIGYKSNIEGFVDTGWTMNVARIGNVAGLFDRLNFDGAKAVTRDEACQLALNTLKATMVDYGNANTVVSSSGEVLTVQGSKAQYVTSNNRDINANINRRVINAANNEMTLEFGEEHFKDLRLEHDRYDPAYDVYGHPSNEWSYKKVTIGTFKLPADFTFTKQMAHLEDTVATKEKALGLRGYDTYSTDHKGGYVNWSTAASNQYYSSPFADATQIHINGWNARVRNDAYKQTAVPKGESAKQGNWYTYDARSIDSSSKDLAPSLSELCDLTDNGVTVEVYVCPVDADFITDVVVTRTQLMEVDRVASDFVELDTIDSDSKDPRKDGKLTEIAGYNDYALYDEVISVKDNNYDAYNVLKDLKSGDEVAIIPYTADDGKTWEVGEAYVPETVSGALTNVDIYNTKSKPDGNAVAITVGGTTYPIAQWNKDMREIDGYQIRSSKKDVTLLLDKMGNALLAKDVGASDNWIVVGDYYQATGTNSRVSWFVHGWTIKGDEVDLELGTIRGAAEKYAPGELVKYRVAENGNGEYELVKPLFRDDDYTNGRRIRKDGKTSSWVEPQGSMDGNVQTGEGIYNIAQYAVQTGVENNEYSIKSRNTLLPLEFYNTARESGTAGTVAGRHVDYSKVNSLTSVDAAGYVGNSGSGFYETPDRYNTWTYRTAPYDGVKFIFVGFDETNGEVDTINVLDGVQNVDHKELLQINRYWKNVGTNSEEFVTSPAEAYVDKNGKVKAVVIKSDSAEANLNDLMIITDNRGANTSVKSTGAEAPTSGTYYTRQYVSGADGFKEEKTGYFDRALSVGTVITGREGTDGIIKTRTFHADAYTNRNPDGFYVKGIEPLKTLEGKKSDYAFYVGPENGGGTIEYLGTGVKGNQVALTESVAEILTGKDVMGIDIAENKEGLIRVDSTTQFIDLRDGRPGNISELSDLFDEEKCDKSTVELKILVNGNSSSDGFRHAYAIMILNAKPSDGSAGSSGDKVDGSRVTTSYRVNDRTGWITHTLVIERPDWVPADAKVTAEYYVSVDGFRKNLTVSDANAFTYSSSQAAYTASEQTLQPDENSEVVVEVTKVTWTAVNVSYEAPTNVEGVTETVATGAAATVSFRVPAGAYRSGTVDVKQNGKSLMSTAKALTPEELNSGYPISVTTNQAVTSKDGAVVVEFNLTGMVVDVENPGNYTEETITNAATSGTKNWVIENLDPGVYILEGLPTDQSAGSPFDQNCNSKDTRTFVYQRNGEEGKYTLKIDGGSAYTEETSEISGDPAAEKDLFNVQVSKYYSDVFHNYDGATGTMHSNGTPLNPGTHTWEITSPSGVVLASGTIRVEAVGMTATGNGSRQPTLTTDGIEAIPSDGTDDEKKAVADSNAEKFVQDIKDNLDPGAYIFPNIQTETTGTTNQSVILSGTPDQNRLFKFNGTGRSEIYTFTLFDSTKPNEKKYQDSANFSDAGGHYFFIQVAGEDILGNTIGSGGTNLTSALGSGSYPWQIVGSESGMIIQGVLAIS
ncbi:S-layer homology domain-containing protein [uncultured Oscillibacter sp.]|uniref:S-layer homology domain-containing protein n=3 Tax=uncultured Oscillibacter sp. TaxID=876091 RepID=UPI00262BDC28|nr:S-layer homology domain-containing protein [uncultured Oscillibacter sp.]